MLDWRQDACSLRLPKRLDILRPSRLGVSGSLRCPSGLGLPAQRKGSRQTSRLGGLGRGALGLQRGPLFLDALARVEDPMLMAAFQERSLLSRKGLCVSKSFVGPNGSGAGRLKEVMASMNIFP